jgi:hypothetical protein
MEKAFDRCSRALIGKILKVLGQKTSKSDSKMRCGAQEEQLGEELVLFSWPHQVFTLI